MHSHILCTACGSYPKNQAKTNFALNCNMIIYMNCIVTYLKFGYYLVLSELRQSEKRWLKPCPQIVTVTSAKKKNSFASVNTGFKMGQLSCGNRSTYQISPGSLLSAFVSMMKGKSSFSNSSVLLFPLFMLSVSHWECDSLASEPFTRHNLASLFHLFLSLF